MEAIYKVPFTVLECPKLKLTYPTWIRKPSSMVVFYCVLISYFFVCAGNYKNYLLNNLIINLIYIFI